MNKISSISMLLLATIFVFSSCDKDKEVKIETENYKGLIVTNEGGFNKSNASVGVYKPGDKSYFDAFKKANDRPIGDVIQSMVLIGDKYYIVVNNSNKIEVINRNDFKSVSTIATGSPRYVLSVSSDKAYISNLYSNTIKVLNPNNQSLGKEISINNNSEHMVLMDKKAYVGTFSDKIMVINTESDSLVDSINTASGLGKIVNATANKIGVLCTGKVDWNNGSVLENGKILIINKDSMAIEKSINLSTGSYGGSMVYSTSTGMFYFSLGNNVVYKMGMDGVITPFVTLTVGQSVYSLSISNSTNEIFVTDAGDFNSAGKVIAYDFSAVKLYEFAAGIAPNGVLVNN